MRLRGAEEDDAFADNFEMRLVCADDDVEAGEELVFKYFLKVKLESEVWVEMRVESLPSRKQQNVCSCRIYFKEQTGPFEI